MSKKHVIVINVAGLSPRHLEMRDELPNISGILKKGFSAPLTPSFPAVTCSVQASILTGKFPEEHGIVANGFFDREILETRFWEQSARLVRYPQIWDVLKEKDSSIKTAVLFWQNTMFSGSDIVITPRPLHTESGMVQWCYSKPAGFYEELTKTLGEFDLRNYWGPLASVKSSEWIMGAAIETLKRELPDLLMVYIPHLDYSSQKFGINTEIENKDVREVDRLIGNMVQAVDDLKLLDQTVFIIHSEYSLVNVSGGVCLNKVLRKNGLLSVREIQGKEYIDFEMSKAFAMVDHQMAHIYVNTGVKNGVKGGYVEQVRSLIEGTEGVAEVWGQNEKKEHHINHERSGELIAIAKPDKWFAYYWWEETEKAPEFTRTVDIHRKPGYDPMELFFDPKIRAISTDTNLLKGSHGLFLQDDSQKACLLIGGAISDKVKQGDEYKAVDIFDIIQMLLVS